MEQHEYKLELKTAAVKVESSSVLPEVKVDKLAFKKKVSMAEGLRQQEAIDEEEGDTGAWYRNKKVFMFFQFVVYQAKSGSGDRVDNAHILATN